MQKSDFNFFCQGKHVYLRCFLVLLYFIIIVLLAADKTKLFEALNFYHNKQLDIFVRYYTHLGDGIFSLLLCLFIYISLRQKLLAAALLLAYATSGIVAQLLKAIIKTPRPKVFFAPNSYPFFIDDIINVGMQSFPSGHTATAFAVACTLIIFTSSKFLNWVYFTLACFIGYSRIYLSQHFLLDITGGAIIGVACGIICSSFILRNNFFQKFR